MMMTMIVEKYSNKTSSEYYPRPNFFPSVNMTIVHFSHPPPSYTEDENDMHSTKAWHYAGADYIGYVSGGIREFGNTIISLAVDD
jgi:hypothetical protein